MNTLKSFLIAAILFTGMACNNEKHFITDAAYRTMVAEDFEAKRKLLPQGNLFTIFDQSLTTEEREAMEFLYAYMPVADICNNSGDLFLDAVRSSLQARNEMPWGKQIPEEVFRHFVLPVRVNNEDLDNSRLVFHDELKERIKGLSLYDAVLEVNHWCHEKVVYTPSDGRTIAPLACVKTAMGRCGEESTFTVAALRSVGIPARQIYTPRWAHTDSNHAWVEAWVDGQWYFFGACEPEPVLNLGWFNNPAYRAMLLHTRVFGKYNGPEEIMSTTANFTEINVLENYAPVATGSVRVVDANNQPVAGADVQFQIYNGASFFAVATRTTAADGTCQLSAGKGDLFIWADKDGKTGCGKLSVGKDNQITIVLDKEPGTMVSFDMDIVPPVDGTIVTDVTEEQKAANAIRLTEEDAIRGAYVATFCTPEKTEQLSKELGIDDPRAADYLMSSRGNWRDIKKYLETLYPVYGKTAVDLLSVISFKDLQDTPYEVLRAHLEESTNTTSPLFTAYILNPRVANELVTPYKKSLREAFDESFINQAIENPALLVEWCNKELRLINEYNPQRITASPTGVLRARVCDQGSKDVFFVALCRSLGIPARLEPATGKVQYNKEGWQDVNFSGVTAGNAPQGTVKATWQPTKIVPDPAYGNHFSIARIVDGKLQTLNYRGARGRWSQLLKTPLTLDEGNYILNTGTRKADGSLLAHIEFFSVEAGKNTCIPIV
ncbi:MAG: transglutaminase domain-containing protein, partial [Tannerellaceae bacterium]|nr:transglutaminase domain-containing protein [Tannerellaceae bacterium]